LFGTRLAQLTIKDIDGTLRTLTEALAEPAAVGDLDALRTRLGELKEHAKDRRREISAEREKARATALAERTTIVERAEAIAATDPARMQWRAQGERLRGLLEEWKQAQKAGPRLDRPSEDALWKRFAAARSAVDRPRRQYLRSEARRVGE